MTMALKIRKQLNKLLAKIDLREACRRAYGDDFIEMYDDVCRGIPIGGIAETAVFLDMVEMVREGVTIEKS